MPKEKPKTITGVPEQKPEEEMGELPRALMSIGFEKNDALTFTALLELKSATGYAVANAAKLFRSNAYGSLQRLVKNGYASHITKNEREYYQAVGVDKIRKAIGPQIALLEKTMPLIAELEAEKMEHDVSVYEGTDGIKTILDRAIELANAGDEIVGFGEKGNLTQLIHGFMDDWHAKRIAKGIRIKRLFNRDPKSKSSVRKLSGTKLTEQRMMPEGMASTLGVWTCNDRTILWFIKEKPLAIVIGNAEIAKGFRKQFDFLWELAGKK